MVSGMAARLCKPLIIFANVNTKCWSFAERGSQFGSASGGIFGDLSRFEAVLDRVDIIFVWRH